MTTAITKAPTAPPADATQDVLRNIGPRLNHYSDSLGQWVQSHSVDLIIAAIAGTLIYLATSWLRRRAARSALKRGDNWSLSTIALKAFARTGRFFRIMLAIELVTEYASAPPAVRRIVFILFTIAVVIQAAIWMREIILALIERRAQLSGSENDTLASAMALIRVAVSFILFAVAAIVILSNLGVNVTGLVAGLGVGGIAIGLAAQGIFSDLFAAISIIFDQPFRRGDTISYDTTTARVEKIGMKSTRLRALTGEEKIIANSKLLEKEITNVTTTNYRRTQFLLGLVYHTPPEKAAALPDMLRRIVEDNGDEFIRAGFTGFGASSLDFQLTFDVHSDDIELMFAARHRIGLAIIQLFAAEGLEFAYPTQTTYTAAPDGKLVMPYAAIPGQGTAPAKRKS